MRRSLVISMIVTCIALPVIIGASCPSPSAPFFTDIGTTTGRTVTQVPDCSPGFVCISIINTTCIDVEVALYVHNGFDLGLDYCEFERGITIVGTPLRASEECPGYNLGEYQIALPQLFDPPADQPSNLYTIQGQETRILKPRETLLERIELSKIKTFGVRIGRVGTLPGNPALTDAPRYRCTRVPLGTIRVPRSSEDVPTGETFQYVIVDELDCGLPGAALFALRTGTSSTGGCPSVR